MKTEDRHLELNLPEIHFISTYLKWTSNITDAYIEYHYLGALWILSTLAQNKCFIKLKHTIIKPNLYLMCLGFGTSSRKSTAVNHARKIYEKAIDCTLHNEDFSIEGYLETLSINPIYSSIRDEASGLLAKYHKQYNDGIFDVECAMYDGQSYRKVLASGRNENPVTYTIINPYVSKLYATTFSSFSKHMTIDDFECGYGYRFLYASPKYDRPKKGIEMETSETIDAWSLVLKQIKTIELFIKTSKEVSFTITSDSIEYYNETINKLEEFANEQDDELLSSMIGRSQEHILKIAILLQLGTYSKEPFNTLITIDIMKTASTAVINYFLPNIREVILQLRENIIFNDIEKLTNILRRLGGTCTHTKLLHDSKIESVKFRRYIETMIESNTIASFKKEDDKTTYYKLVDGMTHFKTDTV